VILYEMASGKVPFDADNFMGILTQHMYKSPAPIRALIPQPQEVPPGLEAIVLKCLSKKVELRYQSMEEVAADLERSERGMVPAAVQEMMGRSGGFNVPADYFRKAQLPTGAGMVPASPPYRQKKPVLAMVLASVAAVSLLIVGVVVATTSKASSRKGTDPAVASATAADPALGSGAAPAGTGTPAPPADEKIKVLINVDPKDATISLTDGKVDGKPEKTPATVTIGATQEVTFRIERKGYEPQVVKLRGVDIDRRAAWRIYTLNPLAGTPVAKPPAGKPQTTGKPPVAAASAALSPPPVVAKPPAPTPEGKCDFAERDPFTHKCP
jgi:serine/threonine-protein kinase